MRAAQRFSRFAPPLRCFGLMLAFLVGASFGAPICAAASAKTRGPDVELRNSVEDLLATSVKALDLRLPADGVLELDLLVHRGPGVTLHIISRAKESSGWKVNQFRIYPDFSASDTTTARKTAWLPRGDYYLTLINPSASDATKVRVFARFRPAPRDAATVQRE